jgi:hypothetical protein
MDPLHTAKEIAKLVQEYHDIPLKKMIVQLQDEIIKLQEENRGLKQRLGNREEMLPNGPHNYFYKGDLGPYCPTCWQRDNKPILLPAVVRYMVGPGRYCRVCKGMFSEDETS